MKTTIFYIIAVGGLIYFLIAMAIAPIVEGIALKEKLHQQELQQIR